MKTKVFIEKVKTAGFNVNVRCEDIQVHHHRYGLIATVQINKRYVFDIRQYFDLTSLKEQEKLFSCIVEYARTPLEEREEEKKYRYKLSSNFEIKNTLTRNLPRETFFFSSIEGEDYRDSTLNFQKYFTDKDVERMPKDVRDVFNACEKIEVYHDTTSQTATDTTSRERP